MADKLLPGDNRTRCEWCLGDPLYLDYHDTEWGTPERRAKVLFEFLLLEGAQAGLSWITILRKRDRYRQVLDGFDPLKIARYDERKKQQLLSDGGIVCNRLKIESVITNAQAYLEIESHTDGFSDYIWSFVDGTAIQSRWRRVTDIPAESRISANMAKELKRSGFRFVGSTICYAFMQAMGLVNDHLVDCFRHEECHSLEIENGPQ
ncbi:MAG: DNA-3-methyladenine glycosylase I [Pseudomonadales bacterium]|nr:DNA-3-methyladenine glycosylase I [Pseudomonadales bacterium]